MQYQYTARPRAKRGTTACAVHQAPILRSEPPNVTTAAVLPHALSRIGTIQCVTVHAAAKLGGYHATAVGDRPGVFAALRLALKPFESRLTLMKTRLTDFMKEIELVPAADNPLVTTCAEVVQLRIDLLLNPTQTRWNQYQAREQALLGLVDENVAAQGYAHEKNAILAKLKLIRKQTVGQREYILTQLGADESWMTAPQAQAVVTLRRIKTDVDQAFTDAQNAGSWTDYEALPKRLSEFQKDAMAATDVPFQAELAGGWVGVVPDVPTPRLADNYYQNHILDRHKNTSTAVGAGKFLWDDWTTIKARIDTARGAGVVTGPVFNEDDGHPQGRFEIVHATGAQIGTTIGGAATNTIKLIISRTGKTVITAYPL
jgi:hypothetical protein